MSTMVHGFTDAEFKTWLAEYRKTHPPKNKQRGRSKAKGKKKHQPVRYLDYIQSKTWYRRRQSLFQLRGKKCEMCGSSKDVRVHHKTYERLGHEKMKDLQVLCFACHEHVHHIQELQEQEDHMAAIRRELFAARTAT